MTIFSMDIGISLSDYPQSKKYARVIYPCIVCWGTTKSLGGAFAEQNESSPKQPFFTKQRCYTPSYLKVLPKYLILLYFILNAI